MRIKISYQLQDTPPPFAYAAVMELEVSTKLKISFQLEYLGREELSDEELRVEGFSRDDDFQWSGEISNRWANDVEQLVSMDYVNTPDHEIYFHVEKNNAAVGFPRNIELANKLFQELMQAILEKSQIEAPLEIEMNIDGEHRILKWIFADRMIKCNDSTSEQWDIGRSLMNEVFNINFEKAKYQKKVFKNSINPGDGLWYSITDQKLIDKINQMTKMLISNN